MNTSNRQRTARPTPQPPRADADRDSPHDRPGTPPRAAAAGPEGPPPAACPPSEGSGTTTAVLPPKSANSLRPSHPGLGGAAVAPSGCADGRSRRAALGLVMPPTAAVAIAAAGPPLPPFDGPAWTSCVQDSEQAHADPDARLRHAAERRRDAAAAAIAETRRHPSGD